jgi:AraC family transcriptional regulator, arabinose operon regulatory protein
MDFELFDPKTRTDQSRSVYQSGVQPFAQTTASSRPVDRRIEVVVMMLERNSHKQIPIREIARLVNLSPGRLAHLFKSEMQLSIQQYLTQVRLAKAKCHLESSFLSIKEIAASVGFSSVTRFVVCFKNFAGATPAHYRKHFLNPSYRGAGILS